ncbi:MAG: large conductance mechanosensitive channel protein MscL [Clostridia bacterium]|nr:large conductance mechanosensitive channel protein MscL [Clostridia bacterium]
MAKEKKEGKVKKFFGEFKKFITRGNVLDMSVGVIVGGAFTGIVNGLSNFILKPIINWLLAMILGTNGLEGVITMLSPAYALDETGAILVDEAGKQVIDLANSIYIDWGSFISAIINFLLIAFVLFSIVKTFNRIAEESEKMRSDPEWNKKKAVAKIRMEKGVSKKEALVIWQAQCEEEKAKKAEEERIAKEKAEEEKRLAEEKAMANTRLLEEIRDLLKQK